MTQESVRAEAVGHSFALATLQRAEGDALIVETTGWERVQVPGFDAALNAEEEALSDALPEILAKAIKGNRAFPELMANICGVMASRKECQMYERVLLGHGCMYFTREPKGTAYGAGIEALRSPLFRPRWTSGATLPEAAFTLDTREFILQLCTDDERAVLCVASPSTTRLWPPVQGARAALDLYDVIQADLPARRRCLRPPAKSQTELEAIMIQRWAPIELWPDCGSRGGGLLFSVPATARTPHEAIVTALRAHSPRVEVRSFPFMMSRIYSVRLPHQPYC